MNYTSIEQSRKLLELGLSPESADMCYIKGSNAVGIDVPFVKPVEENNIPCWSLGALIEVMPDRIWGPDDEYGDPCAHELVFKAFGRTLEYEGILASDYRLSGAWFKQETDNLIDIFYDMVVWLLENGYIKKGE